VAEHVRKRSLKEKGRGPELPKTIGREGKKAGTARGGGGSALIRGAARRRGNPLLAAI